MSDWLPYLLCLGYAASLFGFTWTLYLTVKQTTRVCKEMRKAQREFFDLHSKYTSTGFSETRDEGTLIEYGSDDRVTP